jgi:ABC-type nitrate/sulfonate/bicarbonate transport system permease component
MTVLEASHVDAIDTTSGFEVPKRRIWTEPNTLKAISLLVLLGAWELIGAVSGIFFSTPGATFAALWQLTLHGGLASATWDSLQVFLLGFVVAAIVGVTIGVLGGYFKTFGNLIDVPVTIFWSTPTVALIPIMVLWLGLDIKTQLLIVFLSTLFPVIINTQVGVQTVPPLLIDVSRSFGKSHLYTFWRVILPAAAPQIGSGIRLGVGRAIIGVFVAELFTATTGLGANMQRYTSFFQTANYFAALLVFIAMSVTATLLISWLTRRWLKAGPR